MKIIKKILICSFIVVLLVVLSVYALYYVNTNFPSKRSTDKTPTVDKVASVNFGSPRISINTSGDQGCPILSSCVEGGLVLKFTYQGKNYKMNFASCKLAGGDGEVYDCDDNQYRLNMTKDAIRIIKNKKLHQEIKFINL